MDKDRIVGSAKQVKGAVKQVVGKAMGAWILEPSATELYVNRICTSLPSSLRIA